MNNDNVVSMSLVAANHKALAKVLRDQSEGSLSMNDAMLQAEKMLDLLAEMGYVLRRM